jgi:hypothetical protein
MSRKSARQKGLQKKQRRATNAAPAARSTPAIAPLFDLRQPDEKTSTVQAAPKLSRRPHDLSPRSWAFPDLDPAPLTDLEKAIAELDPSIQRIILNDPRWRTRFSSPDGLRLRQTLEHQLRTGSIESRPIADPTVDGWFENALLILFMIGVGGYLLWLAWPVPVPFLACLGAMLAAQRANRWTDSARLTAQLDILERILFGFSLLTGVALAAHLLIIAFDAWID